MVQWIKGGIYGAINTNNIEGPMMYFNMYGDLENISRIGVLVGDMEHVVFVENNIAKGEFYISEMPDRVKLFGYDLNEDPIEMQLSMDEQIHTGTEFELMIYPVTELSAEDKPNVFLTEPLPLAEDKDTVSFESFRKSEKSTQGAVFVETYSHTSESTDLIVFKGLEAKIGEKEHRFYESESKPGLRQVEVFYRLNYLSAYLLLQEMPHETPRIARIHEKIGIDERGMLQSFPYHIATEVPSDYVVSGSEGIIYMGGYATSTFEALLLNMRSAAEFTTEAVGSMIGAFYYENPMDVMEITIEGGGVVIKQMVDSWKKDVAIKGPKVLRYKSGEYYHVKVTGEGEQAAIEVSVEHDTIHFDIMSMVDGEAHFIIKEGKLEQGQTLRVATKVGDSWSEDTEVLITDAAPVYPVTPEIVSIETMTHGAIVTYETPIDDRFAYARLYNGSSVVQDELNVSVITLAGLDPLTEYSFKLAFVDNEGFESDHVAVDFTTDEEIAEAGSEPIRLRVDNVRVTYKI